MRLISCLLAVAALACLAGSLTMPVLRYANRDFARYDTVLAAGGSSPLSLLLVPVIGTAAVVIVIGLAGLRTRITGFLTAAVGALQLLGAGDTALSRRDNVIMWDGIDPTGVPIGGMEQPDIWWGLAFAAAAGFALIAAGIVQLADFRTRSPGERHGS